MVDFLRQWLFTTSIIIMSICTLSKSIVSSTNFSAPSTSKEKKLTCFSSPNTASSTGVNGPQETSTCKLSFSSYALAKPFNPAFVNTAVENVTELPVSLHEGAKLILCALGLFLTRASYFLGLPSISKPFHPRHSSKNRVLDSTFPS